MAGGGLYGRRGYTLAAACILVAFMVAAPSYAAAHRARTYYVSVSGADTNDGLSPTTPWRTLDRVASETLYPGDAVLFRGGDTFMGTLKTASSGAIGAPIVFTSYGIGKPRIIAPGAAAALYLRSNRYLRFEDLDVTAATSSCVQLSVFGDGSTDVSFSGLRIHDCGGAGLTASNLADARVVLAGSTIANTENCGVFFRGSAFSITGNLITNTGLDSSEALSYPLHGIYAKGQNPTITDNTIVDFETSGITIRFAKSDVEHNTIVARTRGTNGISYYQETATPGTTTISGNTISGVSVLGIAIDNGSTTGAFGGGRTTASTSESFVVAGNSITMRGDSAGYSVEGIRVFQVPSATVVGNRVQGRLSRVYNGFPPTRSYTERDNAWQTPSGASTFGWNGTAMPFRRYVGASRQGVGDTVF